MNLSQTIKKSFSRAAMMLLPTILLSLTAQTALAESVTYIDAEGVEKTANATVITSSSSNLAGGWYVVKNNVTLTGRLNFTGDAHLILADGATLTIPCINIGNAVYFGLTCDKGDGTYNDITIYGQSGGTGKISSSCSTTSSSWSYCYFAENITINGGVVEAAGTDKGIFARNNITINGGQVSAVTTKIYASNGTLTLGWRKATDFIQAREYVGSIHFASRFIYQDNNNIISATDEKNENGSYLINNHKLEPDDVWGVMTSGADGSEAKPYIITTTAGLDLLAQNVNAGNNYKNKYFKLDANIFYNKNTANNFTPIGNNTYSFYGTFDGNGKTISGLNINLPETDYVGLFGNVTGATIKCLTLANSTITGKDYVGGILGNGNYSNTIVQNCAVNNVTVSGTSCVGGIVGKSAIVRGCTSAATVKGDGDYVGGIVGLGEFTTIEYCLYTGNSVTAKYYKVGAIIGDIGSAQMTANYYTQATIGGCNRADRNGARKAYTVELPANVVPSGAATTYDVSGITAYAGNHIILYNNGTNSTYYSGDGESVTLSYTGDLADGYAARYKVNDVAISGKTFTMQAAKATITITIPADVWGVTKGANGSETKPYIITTTEGLDLLAQKVNAGTNYYQKYFKLDADITYDKNKENNFTPIGDKDHAFAGTFDGNGKTISGLNINLSTTIYVGLFGKASSATIKGMKLDNSTITGQNEVGGILGIGVLSSTTIENCAVTSTVTVSGIKIVGGIVGVYANVRGCTSAAAVKGNTNVGGIIGYGLYGTIERCLYTGSTVTATNTASPLKGAIIGSSSNCSLKDNYYTQATIGGCNGADEAGARKAVVISAADGVTIAPTGDAETYDVSGITFYDGNTILGCAGKLYVDATTENVKLNISYTVPEGYAPTGYTDGNGNALTGNDDGTYTLTMTDAAPTITATTADVWGIAAGADGTSEETAYTITTPAGLDLLAQKVNAGNTYEDTYFKLGDDITYPHLADGADGADTENNYTAIGNSSNSFLGKFDGKGYTISGIRIYKGGNDYTTDGVQGLFGYIGSYAEVKNVTLTDTRITAAEWAGGIVGNNGYGTIADCHVTNTVKILAINEDVFYHGGIVGQNDGLVSGCISEATLTGGKHYGGIVGWNSPSSTISGCISKATLTNVSGGRNYGGIAGMNYGTLENNFVIGATIPSAQNNSYGAITGLNYDGTLKNNYYTACTVADTPNATNVGVGVDSNNQPVGDVVENNGALYDVWDVTKGADGSEAKPYIIKTIAGLDLLAQKVNAGTDYYDTYFKLGADITYTHKADGADGADTENNYTSIGNYYKYFNGHFDGQGYTISGIRIYKGGTGYSTDGYQGLFGQIASYAEVKNITLTDTRITAASEAGGIAGSNASGTIANCHVTNTVKIQAINEVNDHGGIVGENTGGTVNGCISEATLTNVSGSYYGGIAGYNSGTLENNFVIGATIPGTHNNNHGAIVGQNLNGTLKNNYYTACTVAGTANATNVGVGVGSNYQSVGDVADNNGALSVHQITFAEGVTDVTIDAGAKAYSYDSKDYYAQGKSVKLTWTPATGYIFSSINAGEDVTGTLSENTYTITMPAKDVTVSVSFKKLLTNTDITVSEIAGQTCTGSEIKPAITVKDGTTDITNLCDITFADNKAVGTATVTITAKASSNAYAGETTTTFDILRQMKDLFADGNQWTGYVAEEDLDLPAGLTAYVITALGEESATATALNYIPKGEPVLLSREDKGANLYLASAGSGTAPATNLLKVASTTVQPVAYQDYALYKDAFILYGGGTLASGKVFLALPQSSKSRPATRSIVIDGDDTTGMSEALSVESEESAGDWYDLQGRRLEGRPLKRGLYIHNGQKTVIK